MPSSPLPDRFPEPFHDRLLAWWDRAGRKNLPWQHPRSPYRVWVSEIMLQQTQVAAVIPYFERWMARFPDLESLAKANLDEVLSLWSGLGYYARARNLHRAARVCMKRFGGSLPEDAADLSELPGIGPSTASAIVSLAHDRPAAVLDGNVKRLLARHAAIAGWPGASKVQRRLWQEAQSRLPQTRAGDYSQAVMDLGAVICKRRDPRCSDCPVSADCRALQQGITDSLPDPRPKKEVPSKELHMLILRDQAGRVLLQRRPPDGIWGGLWSLPEGKSLEAIDPGIGPGAEAIATDFCSLPELEHRLTHLHLRIRPALLTLPPDGRLQCDSLREGPDSAWFGPEDWHRIGLPKPVNDLLQTIEGDR